MMNAHFSAFYQQQPRLRREISASRWPWALAVAIWLALLSQVSWATAKVEFAGSFSAEEEGYFAEPERPLRQEACLNGRWQFQPEPVPPSFQPGSGKAPVLPPPDAARWESTPIKIPSPWNVNLWGNGRDTGEGTKHPYVADSVYYPSYPARWDGVQMGWLRRSFRVPPGWAGKRLLLRFEAVAGEAQVFVNGQAVGNHFDSFLPFEFDVTDLVRAEGDNEILVGVRKSDLFDVVSPDYPSGQRRTYPNGSNMDHLVGIWNDVFLLAVPEVRTEDAFVRANVGEGTLAVDLTLRNNGSQTQVVRAGASVSPWVNLVGKDPLAAPISRWRLDPAVLNLPAQEVTLPPGKTASLTLQAHTDGKLQSWTPDHPNLYGLVVRLTTADGSEVDRRYVRFGWRQFRLRGRELLLNGQPMQLFGDFCHPFGPFINSRRYVWADYRMIKDFGGNAVRPHANVMPRFWLDLADEMGLCVLDESAIFGSSIALNLREPVTWERLESHVDNLVRRDRNHPSVVGWSPANEMFALFLHTTPEDKEAGYTRLKALAQRPRTLDPTRDWISVDGDKDLEGTLPVWSSHFGIGIPRDLPDIPKARSIGEHGGTYFAGPPLLQELNGNRAFENYAGRNEALAADLYRMVTQCARPQLTAFSPSELVWFGLEPLPFGYRTDERPPNQEDGIFFANAPENTPGVQIERLPPYVTTLNPGFDPALPLYQPLAMFDALRAALDPRGPQPGPWDHVTGETKVTASPTPEAKIRQVAFLGDEQGTLHQRLVALGVPLVTADAAKEGPLLIVDAGTVATQAARATRDLVDRTTQLGGLTWIMTAGQETNLAPLAYLAGGEISTNDRRGSSLIPVGEKSFFAGWSLGDLYFAADAVDPYIQKSGLQGPLLVTGRVLLTASETDWSLFERQPESRKCSSVVIYEHVRKPSGAALVEVARGPGKLWISTLDVTPETPLYVHFWTRLFRELGVALAKPGATPGAKSSDESKHDLLLDGPPK